MLAPVGASAQSREAQNLFSDAQRRAFAGSWTRAVHIYERIIEMEPEWGQPAFEAALLSQRLNQFERCGLFMRHYLYLSPTAANLGEAYAELSKCEGRIAGRGAVTVHATQPEGALIKIDGISIGVGSVENVALAPGQHTISVEKLDFDTFTQTFEIASGETTEFRPNLPATIYYGQLILHIDQPDALVAVDGREIGDSSAAEAGTRLLSGRYLLTIDKPGFHRWQRYIDIPRNGKYENNIRMLREGARY